MSTQRPASSRAGSQSDQLSPDFPLFRHASNQYAKKIGGKMFYFGIDPEAALQRYERTRKALAAGKPAPKRRRGGRPRKTAERPEPDFPLFRHRNGQWCKKVKGKMHYFGVEAEAALDNWLKAKDDLLAGRTPAARNAAGLTLSELCNTFLTAKKNQMTTGELSGRTWGDYHKVCDRLIRFFSKGADVQKLRPEDFGRFRAKLAKTLGPVALKSAIIRSRVVFNFAFENDYIEKPIRYGTLFKPPAKKVLKKAKREGGSRVFTPDELRKLLDNAKQPMRSMILLGINCGFGASDLASLPLSAVDLDSGFLDFPRPKTEAIRRCALWPETVTALRDWLKVRPEAQDSADKNLMFLTQKGARWVRSWEGTSEDKKGVIYWHDYVASEFRKLLHKLGIERRGEFYNLRHTFRTVADASKDQPALDCFMGHTKGDMAEEYRERIGDDRLQAVAEVVRVWLWPKDQQGAAAILPFTQMSAKHIDAAAKTQARKTVSRG